MAGKETQVIKLARKFIRKLEGSGFPVVEAYLYGSYAKGTANPYSDIDVAVVSPKFSGFRFQDAKKIMKLWLAIHKGLEPMPFHPADFQDWHPLVHEIKTTGIKIR